MENINFSKHFSKFNTLAAAIGYMDHAVKHCWTIILGDDGLYWMVTFSQAARLVKQGYEEAEY